MIRGAIAILLTILFTTACQDRRALPPPSDDPGTAGMILLALEAGAPQWVMAFDLQAGRGYPPISWRGDVELVALDFGCSIQRLGLPYGAQTLLDEPNAELRIPRPRRILTTPADEPEWTAAAMSDPLDEVLRRLDLATDNLCNAHRARFEPRPVAVPLDGHRDPAFVLSYDAASTLVGSRDGKIYRVERDGRIDRLQQLEDRTYLGAYRAPGGELWLLSEDGVLARGGIDRAPTTVTSTGPFAGSRIIAMAGPRDPGTPFELFASNTSSTTRVFARLEGDRWQILAQARQRGIFLPAVVWIEPGHAVAIGFGDRLDSVARYRNGTTTLEAMPSPSGLSSIMHHPALGTIVGMDDGTIAQHRDAWRALTGVREEVRFVRTLSAAGGGFVFGASAELNFLSYRFGQYHPDVGFCEGEVLTTDAIAASHLGALGEDALLAATLQGFNSPLGLTILEQTARSGACSGD